MSAICEYCRKQPSVIIRGSHLCSAATLPASGHPECRGDHAPRPTRHRLDLDLAHDLRERVT
jgi:hypothetical protein